MTAAEWEIRAAADTSQTVSRRVPCVNLMLARVWSHEWIRDY